MLENKIIENSIITEYENKIWNKFLKAIDEFKMIDDGDKIAICISGGKDSFLMAKCFQELKKRNYKKFDVIFLSMNPGYNEKNKNKIIENAEKLNIPLEMFETKVFDTIEDGNPCFMCAKLRRIHLYNKAKILGCNKIALGHHFDDVIETILIGILFGSQMQTMMPKLHSSYHENMELIRPLYFIKEKDIINWRDKNNLEFILCACKFTEESKKVESSKRLVVKKFLNKLRKENPNVDENIFNSIKNIDLNNIISYKKNGKIESKLIKKI